MYQVLKVAGVIGGFIEVCLRCALWQKAKGWPLIASTRPAKPCRIPWNLQVKMQTPLRHSNLGPSHYFPLHPH